MKNSLKKYADPLLFTNVFDMKTVILDVFKWTYNEHLLIFF